MQNIKAIKWYYKCTTEEAYNLSLYIDPDLLYWLLSEYQKYTCNS